LIEKQLLLVSALAILFFITPASICAEQPKELTVSTAASLTNAFGEIGQMYKNETNTSVVFNFDGSHALATQMINGAYADVFVSANTNQMNVVKNAGLMNNSSVIVFAENKLSFIVPKNNPGKIRDLKDLAKPGIKIVIGAKDVPVGDYAMQIIDNLGNDSAFGPEYKSKVLANVVSKETNVNYVVAKVALGEADVGFAYVSDVTYDLASKVDMVEIPDKYNVIAQYPMGIVNDSKYPAESEAFIKLVTSDAGKSILEKYGFKPVEGKTAKSVTKTMSAKASA
jgi:molybdate transport system substrate-binding protein